MEASFFRWKMSKWRRETCESDSFDEATHLSIQNVVPLQQQHF